MVSTTDRYRVDASAYVRLEATALIGRVWWVAALAAIVLGVMGTADTRWWYLALMLVFVVYPMALSMAWIVLAGRPAMAWLARPQSIHTTPEGAATISFYRYDAEADDAPLDSLTIARSDISSVEYLQRYTRISLRPNRFDIKTLLIPSAHMPASFPLPED